MLIISMEIGSLNKGNERKDNISKNIVHEYFLKLNFFDPKKNSPNRFMKKLEHRMNFYYKDLYNSLILNKK